jgi:hypothetical protein
MRRLICWLLWMALVGWGWGQQAASNPSAVPTVIRFSGTLARADGKALSGVVGVTFSLYKDEQGGAPLWVETQNVVPDKSGHYTVTLGSMTAQGLPQEIFASGEARWLGMQAQGQAEQPRVLLMSVPYALKAGDAETVGGLPASAFVAASSASGTGTNAGSNQPPVSGGGKPGFIASWKTTTQLTNSKLFQSTAGNIGVDTAKPAANFDVNGSAMVRNTLTLFPKGSAPTLTVNGTAFNVSNTGLVSFVSDQTFPGTGTITGVGTASGSGLMGGGTSGTVNLALTNTCSSGQVLSWSGSAWVCSNAGTGTITGVAHGTYLTGGGSSGNVTLDLDTTKVPLLGTPNIFAGTQTVGTGDLLINTGNLDLPQTASSTSGVITLGAAPFISACCSATSFNTYVGTGAGNFNTQNSDNTAVGYQALTNNTGNTNTAVGGAALTGNTTGNSNTAVGTSSLQVNTTGGSNTAVGAGALESNGLGLSNTALGSGAGHSNTGGNNNTFIGQAADASTQNLSNATAIGSAAIVGESNALVLGAPGINVGIGTATPAYALDVHGTGNFTGAVAFSSSQTFPNTISGVTTAAGSGLTGGGTSGTLNLALTNTCSSGQVLTWSGSAWACTTLSGGGTITGVTAGTGLTGGGTSGNVTLNVDPTQVPLVVTLADGHLTVTNPFVSGSTKTASVALGFAGAAAVSGLFNTATGYNAMYSGTSGNLNTAYGSDAAYSNSSGGDNTATGSNALYYNSVGKGNTATGSGALATVGGNENTGIGYDALSHGSGAAAGNYNTASGSHAGQALDGPIEGSSNTFLGAYTISTHAPLNNVTAVGANAEVAVSNAMVLGSIQGVNSATASTSVGIGTTNPTSLLHVGNAGGNSINNYLRVDGPTAAGSGGTVASFGGYGQFNIDAPGVPGGRFVVTESGQVGIDTAPYSLYQLSLSQSSGHAIANTWEQYSSRRWKTNIQTLQGALEKVEELRGVSYDMKESGQHQIGVIAEEVGAVVPEVVTYEENGKDARGVDYSRLTALLIEATKEQQVLIRRQQEQIRRQQRQMSTQQTQIRRLTSQVETIQATLKTDIGVDAVVRTAAVQHQ